MRRRLKRNQTRIAQVEIATSICRMQLIQQRTKALDEATTKLESLQVELDMHSSDWAMWQRFVDRAGEANAWFSVHTQLNCDGD